MLRRTVFGLSSTLKNLSFSSQNALAYHLSHVEKLKGTRDIQQESLENINDKLSSELRNKLNYLELFSTLEDNEPELQGSHLVTAVSNCYNMMKDKGSGKTSDVCPTSIEWNEQTFHERLYQIIKSNLNKLSTSDTVKILNYLTKMEGSLKTIELLIQYIIKHLNELSMKDFRTISIAFKKFQKNEHLVKLQYAMIKNFVKRISMNYEKDNIDYLADGLYFLSMNPSTASIKLLDLFVKDIHDFKSSIPLYKALLIQESIFYMRYSPKLKLELLKKIQALIMNNIEEVDNAQINNIIFTITYKIKAGQEEFYDSKFTDHLIQKLINDDAGLQSALSALKCLSYMRHYNKEILNYVGASYFETTTMKNREITNHTGKFLIMLTGLSNANHKTLFWDEIENYLMEEKSFLDYHYVTLSIVALSAMNLGFYPIRILEKLFDGNFDYSDDNVVLWTFCKLYQQLKTDASYKGPLPTKSQIESVDTAFKRIFRNREKSHSFPVLPHLEEAMGSPAYVKTHLCTKLFHLIDHVVALDKDGLPIPLNSKTNISSTSEEHIEYVEDLQVPPDSQIVIVLYTPKNWYFRNTNQLISRYQIYVSTLEKMKYKVVTLDNITWKEIPDKEKSTFLQSQIKSKLNTSIY